MTCPQLRRLRRAGQQEGRSAAALSVLCTRASNGASARQKLGERSISGEAIICPALSGASACA